MNGKSIFSWLDNPWGGSKNLGDLAKKFGWPAIITSIVLTPFLMFWKHFFAYPFWLRIFKHEYEPLTGFELLYKREDGWRDSLYEAEESQGQFPLGWNAYADVEGKKFIESFFGIIQVLDLEEITKDGQTLKWILTSNELSWFPARVEINYPCDNMHSVDLYLPSKGPNMYNPFFLITKWFVLASLLVASKFGYNNLKENVGFGELPEGEVVLQPEDDAEPQPEDAAEPQPEDDAEPQQPTSNSEDAGPQQPSSTSEDAGPQQPSSTSEDAGPQQPSSISLGPGLPKPPSTSPYAAYGATVV